MSPDCRAINPLQQLQSQVIVDGFVLKDSCGSSCSSPTTGLKSNIRRSPDPYHYKWFERPQAAVASLAAATKSTRNIAQKLAETGNQAVIFWGSQSGTAEGFAHRLARDCHARLKLDVLVADISEYDHHTIAELSQSQYAIFIMSTYGEGDPSDNSTSFLSWLKSKPEESLQNLRFAAFGCGNSNYKHYNAVIDTVVTSLQGFGAKLVLPVGKADEAKATTDEDFLEWKTTLFAGLCTQLGLTEREAEYETSIKIVMDESIDTSGVFLGEPFGTKSTASTSGSSTIVPLPICAARELLQSASMTRSCLHLEVDLSDHPEIKYKTGDHLAVRPINPTLEVSSLIDVLGLSGRENIPLMIESVHPDSDRLNLPSPTTTSALFQHYLEICAPVSRESVLSLAQFASTSTAKAYLLSLASDKNVFASFLAEHHLTLARLLKHVQTLDPTTIWTDLPLSFVIESLRPMTPRYYSIASSSIISPRRAAITIANNPRFLLKDDTVSIPGLASTYLSSFATSNAQSYPPIINPAITTTSIPYLHASIRRSTFKLPASPDKPIILIAAGTGIAPFRAFLHERARLASLHGQNKPVGRTILFFGCRHPNIDLLYKEELQQLQAALGNKLDIVYAFSRVDGAKKTYVQDRVEERQDDIVDLLLEEDAALYLCGSAAMAREVGSRVGEALKKAKLYDEEGLKKWREERKRAKRWQEDVWG
ncbi:NADPH-ferrihemo protein reductase [Exophiala viscosa]|uniref:NADPH--cytochrome P450 reductase n=1 Tax=Exophiala viscosa TaxID=2486360 RepID=A0AAN6E4J0_9EURO|nr:NADPH-ferrihemo protein reductase [Exophiala viscosa]